MDDHKMMGFKIPGDEKVPVTVRDWNAQKLALWRSKGLAEIAAREAAEILSRCKHLEGCPGASNDLEPCIAPTFSSGDVDGAVLMEGCPDRELRMSILVILNAARQLAPENARKPADPYYAPSREYYSEIVAALGAAQIENEMLRAALREAGLTAPSMGHTSSGNSNGGGDHSEPAQLTEGAEETATS